MAQIKEDVKRCNIFIDLLNMDQIIVYKLCLDFMSFSTSLLLKKAASHMLHLLFLPAATLGAVRSTYWKIFRTSVPS